MTAEEARRFGAILKLWREVNDMSGDVLAAELGTDKFQLSRIENGYQLPVATVVQIAAHIGLDLDQMTFAFRGYRVRLTREEE
jgi:transcriptional regulator with XRE-family HTH domain